MTSYERAYMNCEDCYEASQRIKECSSIEESYLNTNKRVFVHGRAMYAVLDVLIDENVSVTNRAISLECVRACRTCDYAKPKIREILDEKVFKKKEGGN